MSKSVGNVVDPFVLVNDYGADQLRYFLLREVPLGQDGNYSRDAIVQRINADLANDLGNLAQRSLSMIAKNCGGVVPEPGEVTAADAAILAAAEPLPESVVLRDEPPQLFYYRKSLGEGGLFRIRPSLAFFFNDPSGALKGDLSALATWDWWPAPMTTVNTELKLTLAENVSDVTQPSNSLLPHVRTDIAEYKRASDFKLLKAMFNQFYQPATRLYARASAGFYEEMFAGAGGQFLYLSPGGGWAADLAVDALRQRDFEGWFGFQDYKTVTAIASLHYRMGYGLTGTMRAGRFLAKDEGVRLEMKRRFASGIVYLRYGVRGPLDRPPRGE